MSATHNPLLVLALALLTSPLFGQLPATNDVARYERYSHGEQVWLAISKPDGDTVLSCLRDVAHFESWGSKIPPNVRAHPIPTCLEVRTIGTNGETNTVQFSYRGQLVECQRGLLCVPNDERKILEPLFSTWREADKKRITSQPLPCQYRIGSIEDGWTLSGIAKLFYGNASKWPRIWEANKHIIKNPDLVRGGELITIPAL